MPFEIEESVYYGESVQMTCHVSKGDRPIYISWTFEGQDLSTVTGIKTLKIADQTSFLTIASVTGAHSGNYTCIAKNKAGEHRYFTPLHVNGIISSNVKSPSMLFIYITNILYIVLFAQSSLISNPSNWTRPYSRENPFT